MYIYICIRLLFFLSQGPDDVPSNSFSSSSCASKRSLSIALTLISLCPSWWKKKKSQKSAPPYSD